MARIQITIDIPLSGPAQISITTDDSAGRAGERKTEALTQASVEAPRADVLKRTRDVRGWTQAELAKRIGCSVMTIGLIERGARRLTDRMRERIRKAGVILNGNS